MANKKNTYQRIFDSAVEFFARQGFNGTSIKHITDRLGITKPAVYAHFSGKAEIAHKIIEKYESEYLNGLINRLEALNGTVLDKLHKSLSFQSQFGVDYLPLSVAYIKLENELSGIPEFEPEFVRIRARHEAYLTELYRQGIRQGMIKKSIDPAAMAMVAMGVSRGMFLQWVDCRNRIDGEQYIRTFRVLLFKGVEA